MKKFSATKLLPLLGFLLLVPSLLLNIYFYLKTSNPFTPRSPEQSRRGEVGPYHRLPLNPLFPKCIVCRKMIGLIKRPIKIERESGNNCKLWFVLKIYHIFILSFHLLWIKYKTIICLEWQLFISVHQVFIILTGLEIFIPKIYPRISFYHIMSNFLIPLK